ncbi:MAG: 3-oxoacyl-[acyl-carrier-protein] reductase FabG [Planctomycetota bacterium]|jgi:3-oxoacyl-[acyl-carrier protein] reductase
MTRCSKAAVITGGGTGVGRAATLRLAQLGYGVVFNYSRSQSEALDTATEVTAAGGEAVCLQADVAADEDCRKLIATAEATFGRLDVLINCAGTTEFIPFHDLEAVSTELWDRLFRVNVTGAFQCARAAAPLLRRSGGGVIINVSSVAAQLGQGSSIPYCCSKAALDNLTVSLARTLAPEIRVNGIAPGFIAGRWTERGLGEKYAAVVSAYEQALPLHKVCQPDDIAQAIVDLATGSPLITGQTLTVDGGMLISGFQVKFH